MVFPPSCSPIIRIKTLHFNGADVWCLQGKYCLTEHVLWGFWELGIFPKTSKVETSLSVPDLLHDVSDQIHSHLIYVFASLLPTLVSLSEHCSALHSGTARAPGSSYILECSQANGRQMQALEGLTLVHGSCQPPTGLLVCPLLLSPHSEATPVSLALAISKDGTILFPLPAWSCREKARRHSM